MDKQGTKCTRIKWWNKTTTIMVTKFVVDYDIVVQCHGVATV
jgi:hypothetical protein